MPNASRSERVVFATQAPLQRQAWEANAFLQGEAMDGKWCWSFQECFHWCCCWVMGKEGGLSGRKLDLGTQDEPPVLPALAQLGPVGVRPEEATEMLRGLDNGN